MHIRNTSWPKSDVACVTQRFVLKMYHLYHLSYLHVLSSQGNLRHRCGHWEKYWWLISWKNLFCPFQAEYAWFAVFTLVVAHGGRRLGVY